MEEATYTEKYKGLDIEIYHSEIDESPNDWGNEDVFLVGFHRQFTVEREGFEIDICRELAEVEEKSEEAKEIAKKYHFFGLEAYIHSGVALALSNEGNFVDRQWDVSQLGLVFVDKAETKSRAKAKKIAQGLIETWNDYLSGNVYGYMVKEAEASCWGFYGDYETSGILDEAKSEIDDYVKAKKDKHFKTRKAQIRNNVALDKRQTLSVG